VIDRPNPTADTSGLGTALHAMLQSFVMISRGTGRTHRMLMAAQDGDVVVTTDGKDADRLRRELHHMGKSVRVVVCGLNSSAPRALGEVRQQCAGTQGNVHFDHRWIEKVLRHRPG
jgi:GTP:adenosylcobinamide-phosphate guanylyltransferase